MAPSFGEFFYIFFGIINQQRLGQWNIPEANQSQFAELKFAKLIFITGIYNELKNIVKTIVRNNYLIE
jgi:hypothetical protein